MSRTACTDTLNYCQGLIPIVVEAHSADVIATLILLKKEVEEKTGATIKMTIVGATEAHLLVKEIAEAKIGIIFKPSRPFPAVWERRRVCVGHLATPAPGVARPFTLLDIIRSQVTRSSAFQRDGNCALPRTQHHGWHWH